MLNPVALEVLASMHCVIAAEEGKPQLAPTEARASCAISGRLGFNTV